MSATELVRVPFRGSEIIAIEMAGEQYVAIKPICVCLGLDDRSQRRKITSNKPRWGGVILTLPSVSGDQETLCIPRGKLFGWLATISPNKVAAALRDTLIAYQNEADAVLDRYFRQRHAEQHGADQPASRIDTVDVPTAEYIDLLRAKIALLEGVRPAPRRKRPAPRPLSEAERAEIRTLAEAGLSVSEIARRTGRAASTVSMIRAAGRA